MTSTQDRRIFCRIRIQRDGRSQPYRQQKSSFQYRSNMKSSRPVQIQIQSNMRERHVKATKIAGGMCAIMKDSVRLFTPAPASQEMKEWKIPLPVACPANYCFHPGADVIAFVERQEPRYVHSNKPETASSSRCNSCSRIGVHLRILSDGENIPPHCPQQFTTRKLVLQWIPPPSCR